MKSNITLLHRILSTAIFALLLQSCVSEFEADLPDDKSEILVVNGDIIQNTNADFILSKTFSLNSVIPPESSKDITAKVTVVGSDGYSSAAGVAKGKGIYTVSIGELKDNVEYSLRIEHDGNIYLSQPSKPFHTPEIDNISWTQPEEYGNVYLRVSTKEASSSEPQYFVWSYEEDWESPANWYTDIYYNFNKSKIDSMHFNYGYNCWKKNSTSKILAGTTEKLTGNKLVNKILLDYPSSEDRLKSLYCLTLTQKSVSKEAYLFYINKKTENEDMGGIFTPQPSEMSGNIKCENNSAKRSIGFVSVIKNTSTKRFFLDRKDITKYVDACTVLSSEEMKQELNDTKLSLYQYLKDRKMDVMGFWSLEWRADVQKWVLVFDIIGYTPKKCVDCVVAGGTKNKPDFWPNDKK